MTVFLSFVRYCKNNAVSRCPGNRHWKIVSQGQGEVVGVPLIAVMSIFNRWVCTITRWPTTGCRLPGCDLDVDLILVGGGVAAEYMRPAGLFLKRNPCSRSIPPDLVTIGVHQ